MRVLKLGYFYNLHEIIYRPFMVAIGLHSKARKNTERHPHYASYVEKGSATSKTCHAGATSPVRHPPQ